MTGEADDIDDQRGIVAHRIEFIDLLDDEGPLATRDIVDALDHSRSTVTRALRELREADLIEKTADGYVASTPGVMAAASYHRYSTASAAILTSKRLLMPIPEPQTPPVDLLIGADTTLSEKEFPIRPLQAIADRIRDADTVRANLPTLINTRLLGVWHGALGAEQVEGRAYIDPDLLTVLKGQYPQLLAEMAATDGFAAFATAGRPYGIVLTTAGDETTVSVIVYEDETAVRGILTNDTAAAVEWARTEFERLESDAVEVTADLEALRSAVPEGTPSLQSTETAWPSPEGSDGGTGDAGHALPLALEGEGFVRLSTEYFDAHGQAAPAVSWRTGFTLAEVRAGHAVDRLDADGRNLTERLVEQLHDENDQVVLGPPGAGKSTICMQVACEWYERGHGPVLYRERGSGDRFTSVALLEAYLRETEGHALVAVEDAVREQAAAIFDVMQAIEGDSSVTFLLDARSHEWQDAGALAIDARRDAFRRTAIDHIHVPDLDQEACARFVDHFTALVDADLALSGTELYSLVEAGTAADGRDSVSPGDVLVAQHHLSKQYDPPAATEAGAPTALDEAVRRTYRELDDADASYAPDLAVSATLLAAAGIPVADAYLYSIAPPDEFGALDDAIALLEGRLLFEQERHQVPGSAPYRTYHELWAVRFLEQFLDLVPARRARDRFGECVSRLLALADEPQRRREIEQHLDGRTPHIHRIEADPGNWADKTAARVFRLGRTNASLAPLYGETTGEKIVLPAACTARTTVLQAYWRGEMYRRRGDQDRAEREFRAFNNRVLSMEGADEADLKPATSSVTSTILASDAWEPTDVDAHRRHLQAVSLTKLGRIAEMRSDLETAAEYHEESLTLFRELDHHAGEAYARNHLGIVARQRGELAAAAEYHDDGLALFRELAHRHGEAYALGTRGIVALERGNVEAAAKYLEQSLERYREIGDHRGEAWVLDNRGSVARQQGEVATAAEYYEESLALFREIGARRGEARALTNLGAVARRHGDLEAAEGYGANALALYREIGNRHGEADALATLGRIARDREQLEQARSRFAEAADLLDSIGADEASEALADVIDVCEEQGDIDAARDWCRRAIEFAEQTDRRDVSERFRTRQEGLGNET